MEEQKGMFEGMTKLISSIIFGPCEKCKTKLFQRWGMIGWWVYILYWIYLLNFNENILYSHGEIGAFFQAGIGFVLFVMPFFLILIILLFSINYLTKKEKREEVSEKIIKIWEKFELPRLILCSTLSIIFFLLVYVEKKDFTMKLNMEDTKVLMFIGGIAIIMPIIRLIELLTWDIIKSDVGGNE